MIRSFLLTLFFSFTLAACGGGDSSGDSGGSGCSNPDLNASYSFVADGDSNDRFTASFSNNNTVTTNINGGTSGSWAYIGSPPSQISFGVGSETIIANIMTPSITDCRVVTITLTSPDGVAFTGSRQ